MFVIVTSAKMFHVRSTCYCLCRVLVSQSS